VGTLVAVSVCNPVPAETAFHCIFEFVLLSHYLLSSSPSPFPSPSFIIILSSHSLSLPLSLFVVSVSRPFCSIFLADFQKEGDMDVIGRCQCIFCRLLFLVAVVLSTVPPIFEMSSLCRGALLTDVVQS